MTIVLEKNYHAIKDLERRKIICKYKDQAEREDIRSLRIGILNIMPKAETYEYSLLFPLGRSVMQVEPVWIRLKTHKYGSSSTSHLDSLYRTFDEVISEKPLDGLIVTGAPVEYIPFEKVSYWNEIQEILSFARKNIHSTLGICWGGLALSKVMGIEKIVYDRKLFGVFETKNLDPGHSITGCMDDIFLCPYSSFARLNDSDLENESDKGNINLLAHSSKIGHVIFERSDHKFLVHLGHPEYDALRLKEEYLRDKNNGRTDVDIPENFNLENPVNRWRSHCLEFFAQWIKYIHESANR